MWSASLLALTVLSLSSSGYCSFIPEELRQLQRRNIVYNGQIADSYDFVIVGGGTAGLVLASRLSEDVNTTVLVLEAGDTGDAVAAQINIPSDAYFHSLTGSSYDWAYTTAPQPQAAGRALPWPRGKVLGGSSALNGMYLVRPSEIEVNAWANLIDGGSAWNWDALFSSMKNSETFTPPSSSCQQTANIEFNASSRGTSGPIQASYPGYTFPVVGDWTPALNALGVPPNADAYSGEGWGGFVATSSINPSNWTRSYARSAYIDPLPPRPNLSILPNATATKIIFSNANPNNLTAVAVQYASQAGAPVQTVNVTKEVLLAGGSIGSPQLLMLSGVGPSDVLQAAGVPVQVTLPGVGQHLQDHISTEILYSTNDDTDASVHTADVNANSLPTDGSSNPFLSFINSATAYVNITTLLGEANAQVFQTQIEGELSTSIVPSTDPTVLAGYEAIYNVTVQQLLMSPVGQVEILLSLTGVPGNDKTIAIQVALQHPYSHGRLYINSTDPFAYPVIDPNYLAHNADLVLMREGLKFARILGSTAPLSTHLTGELNPGPSVQTDSDWETWLAKEIGTEFHPSGSCAMLPLDQGGVVDANLRVYGLSNVRVADASVFPIEFSAHLGAPTYGLAEQASALIKTFYNPPPPAPTSSSSSASTAPSATQSAGDLGHNAASRAHVGGCAMWAVVAAALTLALL